MKTILSFALVLFVLASCGTKVAYTDTLKDQYDLSPEKLVKVQFFTSSVIILEKVKHLATKQRVTMAHWFRTLQKRKTESLFLLIQNVFLKNWDQTMKLLFVLK